MLNLAVHKETARL